jgi:hypothetical protein
MKLSKEQIAKIEETLVLNGVVYEDIKLELIDHIASEIETLMEENKIPFEEVLVRALENWNDQLMLSYSFWTGTTNVAPRIVIEKWKQIQGKHNPIIGIASLLITIFIIGILKLLKIDTIPETTTLITRWICLLLWIIIVAVRIILWRSKCKTLFGFIFKKRSSVALNFTVLFLLELFPNKRLGINSWVEITIDFLVVFMLMFSISS